MSHDIDLTLIPETVRSSVLRLIAAHDAKELENKLLREQLRLALIKKYGPKSESLSDAQLQLMELEPGVQAAEVQVESSKPQISSETAQPVATAKKSAPHGRSALPEGLPRTVVIVPVPKEMCVCQKCSGATDLIGFEESEQLHVEPAKYSVLVTRREKRACRKCSELGVQTAALPERVVPKGKLSDAFIVDVLIRKYAEHMPVYRQCASLKRDAGIDISRQTLIDAVMVVGDLCKAVSRAMRSELVGANYIQADETVVPVQSQAVRGRNHRAYLWQYSRPNGPVVFDFQMGRSREGPKEFLSGFSGWLQCDGYSSYDKLGPNIQFAGCMAHARRRFFEAHQLAPTASEPKEILELFARIYAVEKEAREGALSYDARRELRQGKTAPIMETLKARVAEIQKNSMPSSKLGDACSYTINQWGRLEKFVQEGVLEADNNWCENGMRPITLGRKNWLHLGDEIAGPKVAAIFSIFETCKRLGINLRDYLNDVLPKLGAWPAKRIGELTPMSWKAARIA